MRRHLNALLALAAAAAISAAVFLLTGASGESGEARKIPGSALRVPLGEGRAESNSLRVSAEPPAPRVLALKTTSLQAETLPLARVDIHGVSSELETFLVWRTADGADRVFFMQLPRRDPRGAIVNLAGHPHWKGTIIELGLDIYSPEAISGLAIKHIELLPPTGVNRLQALWYDWTSATSWSASSINHLSGNASGSWRTANLVLGAVSLLAMLILTLLNRWQGERLHATQLGIVLLIPWVINDLLWQGTLSSRLEEARERFHGKSLHQRHLADVDADVYRYARHIKRDLLPDEPVRVFILHPEVGHVFSRLKLQYYLLPHNVFNHGTYPRDGARAGDYFVVLDTIPGLAFDRENRLLTWPGGNIGPVEVIEHSEHGKVYRLLEGAGLDA